MNLDDLKKPFAEDEIEWRIGQSGKKGNGQIWATCLAYVTGRAIMDRLDQVCGPDGWDVKYRTSHGEQGMDAGVIATIGIRTDKGWVYKEDGAEQTDIESFKGGLSSALKRAGSAWGIGRYLYSLESGFAQIEDSRSSGGRYAKTKDGSEFYWNPPRLPEWALPTNTGETKPQSASDARPKGDGIHPEQPPAGDGHTVDRGYMIPSGKWAKRSIEQIYRDLGAAEMRGYIHFLQDAAKKKNQPLPLWQAELISRTEQFLALQEVTQ